MTARIVAPDRIACVVPFCRRTVARVRFPDAAEWICGQHWRLVPASLKQQRRIVRRRMQKIHRYEARMYTTLGGPNLLDVHRIIRARGSAVRASVAAWDGAKASAIEAAMGIGA